jgi:hypothetical protein
MMARIVQGSMFAREERTDQGIQFGVRNGYVWPAESRDILDVCRLEVGTAEHDEHIECLESGFTEGIDLAIVNGQEGGDAVSAPIRKSTLKAGGVGSQDGGVEGVTTYDEQRVVRWFAKTNAGDTFFGHGPTVQGKPRWSQATSSRTRLERTVVRD